MNVVSIHSAPRSGSSWFQTIFEAHPHMVTKFQPLFSYDFKNAIDESSTTQDYKEFIDQLLENESDFVNRRSHYHRDDGNTIPQFSKQAINTVVMKHVRYHYLIEKFIQLDPHIKIIGLVRDPRGVVNSYIHNPRECSPDLRDTDEWLTGASRNTVNENYFGYTKWKEIIRIFHMIKERYPDNIYIIQYEDIVNHPSEQLEKLFEFLGTDLHPEVTSFIESSHDEDLSSSSVSSVYKTADVIYRWKEMLARRPGVDISNYIVNDVKNTIYEQYLRE